MSVWIVETLLATTLLMALVMMLRRPVARWLGAGAAYLLWALPVARMLLPAIPQEVAAPSPLHHAVDQAGLPDLMISSAMPSTPSVEAVPPFPWLETAVALWLAGVAIFLAMQAIGYVRFRRLILTGSTPLGREGRLRIVASPRATGPLAFGVLRPHIVVPADFELRFDPLEREMALAHERAHHAHGDLAANMVALAVLGVHWCNPVAWIAYRAFRADQEQACDARVLSLYGQDNAHAYGRAILKAAGRRPFAAACHLTPITALKGRLKMLSNHDVSLRRISWGMAAVGALTLAGLAMTASGSRAAQQVAAITGDMPDVKLSRLTDLVAQDAAARTGPVVADLPKVPRAPQPSAPSVSAVDPVPPVPAAPAIAAVPAVDAIAPVPPTPPATPRVSRHAAVAGAHDLRWSPPAVPTEADIARAVPIIDVTDGCDNGKASQRETVTADGRKHVRIRICAAQIERSARAAERAGAVAERQARFADMEAARAERSARQAALRSVMATRAAMARNRELPESARAEVLRDLDAEIADMRADMR